MFTFYPNIVQNMNSFKYYSALRTEILAIVTGVENSGQNLFWDYTTPNRFTKYRLKELHAKHLAKASAFGLLVVTRHCDCENPAHDHDNYPVSNAYGRHIRYRESGYIWNGGQFYQGSRKCVCPCSSKNEETEHWVIDDVIYDANSNIEACTKLEAILTDIYDSINCAGDKTPRSAIREHLLRAILRINDELLPEPIDTYISKRLTEKVQEEIGVKLNLL